MFEFNSLNTTDRIPKAGEFILINRKQDARDVRVLCKVKKVVYNENDSPEIILSNHNDYFIWNMYKDGTSWVWRVWNLGQISMNSATNNMNEFPR
tara:strand:+ start:579 stop:863 length:285 start_codon:yes stop_codon:yes gene_type:complete